MTERNSAGTVDIEQVDLFVLDESGPVQGISLHGQGMLVQTSITQSLFSEDIEASFVVSEGQGQLTNFNKKGLQGQEFVCVKVNKPQLDDKLKTPEPTDIDLQFWCCEIEEIDFGGKGDTESFALRCVTKEKLLSLNNSVNQSYSNTYGNVANSIYDSHILKNPINKKYFKNYGTIAFSDTPFDVHETNIINDFIVPGLQPFKAIDFCARRTFTPKSMANLFTFYQDFDGYHYHNIETLVKDGIAAVEANPVPFTLIYDVSPDKIQSENIYRKIFEISELEGSDTMLNLASGSFKNTVRTFDIIGQTYSDVNFDYKEKFSEYKHLGDASLVDDFWMNSIASSNYEHLVFKDTSKQNQYFEHILANRLPYLMALNNFKCTVTVDGDFFWKPGMVVKIVMPEQSAVQPVNLDEHKFAGYWLIEQVNHSFNSANVSTSLSLIKDSLLEVEK